VEEDQSGKWLILVHLKKTPVYRPLFRDNLGKLAPEKLKLVWILMKQEMVGWQWHKLDHLQIICTLL